MGKSQGKELLVSFMGGGGGGGGGGWEFIMELQCHYSAVDLLFSYFVVCRVLYKIFSLGGSVRFKHSSLNLFASLLISL